MAEIWNGIVDVTISRNYEDRRLESGSKRRDFVFGVITRILSECVRYTYTAAVTTTACCCVESALWRHFSILFLESPIWQQW